MRTYPAGGTLPEMSDLKLTFRCEGCGSTITFPAYDAGMIGECPECGGWVDIPEATRRDPSESQTTLASAQEELNRRDFEECVRQRVEVARQIKLTDRQQEWTRQNLERESVLLVRREEIIDREARLVERYERIAASLESLIANWEDGVSQ